MGRETKILLALLATLAGVFFGVLSVKLLVPRPPVGAGPDVTTDLAGTGTNELVDPPSLSPRSPGPARVEPASAMIESAATASAAADSLPPSRYGESRFTGSSSPHVPAPPSFEPDATVSRAGTTQNAAIDSSPSEALSYAVSPPPLRDPFVAPAGLDRPVARPDLQAETEPSTPPLTQAQPLPAAVAYVANSGDSWWDLAERTYGDGRLYRALFAWNRVLDSRITLAPGTRLEIPTRSQLEAAWPKLIPAE
jgi:nucleoid-associated protein YgaU